MAGGADRDGRGAPGEGGSALSAAEAANPLLAAALAYAARGWPVLPCHPETKRPLNAAAKDPKTQKAIKGTGGVSAASTDPEQVRRWWRKWPLAMVGLAAGHGFFALDFDPRHDDSTGEEWTLERLKAETEAQLGAELPATLAVRTPSGGVHLYFALPDDDGPPIRNRGNLPHHVDVRGLGGYVVAPPSVRHDGERYRWLRGAAEAPIAAAPAELITVLRGKAGIKTDVAADQAAASSSPPPPAPAPLAARRPSTLPGSAADAGDAAVQRYAEAALDAECRLLAGTPLGNRDNQSNASGFVVGQLVGAGALSLHVARAALHAAVAGFGDPAARAKAVDNGLDAGQEQPRDLSAVRDEAVRRFEHYGPRRDAAPPAPPAAASGGRATPFQNGRLEGGPADGGGGVEPLTIAERARFGKVAGAWLQRRLEHVERDAKALTALAWGIGRRVAAGLIEEGAAKEAIWPLCEDVADVAHADIDRALSDGFARGFDPQPMRLAAKCAGYPMTDFGIAERFRDRFGEDYRFTTAKGWLGWDGRRWKVLDQEKDVPPAEVIAAVFETVRAIQDEARLVADTGVKWALLREGKEERLDLQDEGNPHGLDRWVAKGKSFVLLSSLIAAFGRTSESAGKPAAIAGLARRWLTLPIEAFDHDKLAINVLNGTLRFTRGTDGAKPTVRIEPHRREDLQTKLAPVEYDPAASCPLYDSMLAWAQPDVRNEQNRFVPGTGEAMRRYLHQIAGYAATGETGEHQLWFFYGRGRNGKSTAVDSWCAALGDYSGTIGIESFLDQGVKKRGDQATPDLAKLGGVRMLRASEPEQGAKLNAALIKLVTGGEPVSVRALHRGFFDLVPRFKLIVSGNSKPSISETDDGIWGRLRLINWPRHIEKPEPDVPNWPKKDTELVDKIKARELPGVFNHLVRGLLDWLQHRLVEPEAVAAATAAYRQHNDPVSRFLTACTVPDAAGRVKSSLLHEVFVAWAKATGATAREWSNKGLTDAMIDKGYEKKTSNGVQWLGMRLVRAAGDFIDPDTGKVRDELPELEPAEAQPRGPPPPMDGYDDI